MSSLETLAELVRRSHSIVALTGAGISTESGLPDFRSKAGLWNKIDPMEAASLEVFTEDPERFWDFYEHHLAPPPNINPNAAHQALVDLEDYGLNSVITQNVDSLHLRAGSETVLEVHGSSREIVCPQCQWYAPYASKNFGPDSLPRCPRGHVMKPDVVLFGEDLPETAFEAMGLCYDADLLIVCGTSLQVFPVASWPLLTLRKGGKLAILNHEETPLDEQADVVIHAPLGESLPALVSLLQNPATEASGSISG